MRFLVVDSRFRAPVHVFLEQDPQGEAAFPGLAVRQVTLEPSRADAKGSGTGSGVAVGQDPTRSDQFREFGSDKAVGAAGYALVEPRFVGQTWAAYDRMFRFGSKKVAR